jgi:hypothetical protein
VFAEEGVVCFVFSSSLASWLLLVFLMSFLGGLGWLRIIFAMFIPSSGTLLRIFFSSLLLF